MLKLFINASLEILEVNLTDKLGNTVLYNCYHKFSDENLDDMNLNIINVSKYLNDNELKLIIQNANNWQSEINYILDNLKENGLIITNENINIKKNK